jgi:hypothetical protein
MTVNSLVRIVFEDVVVAEVEVSWTLILAPTKTGIGIKSKILNESIRIPSLVDGQVDESQEMDFPLNKFWGEAIYLKNETDMPSITLKAIYIDYETKGYSLFFEND